MGTAAVRMSSEAPNVPQALVASQNYEQFPEELGERQEGKGFSLSSSEECWLSPAAPPLMKVTAAKLTARASPCQDRRAGE